MPLHLWLLFFHVLAAVVWVGGGITLSLIGLAVRKSSDREVISGFVRLLRALGLRAFMPAMVTVLATGVAMLLDGNGFRIAQPWIIIGFSLFLVAFLIGAVYLSRVSIALEHATAGSEFGVAEAKEGIRRWVTGYGTVVLALLAAVWDMVFKPFG